MYDLMTSKFDVDEHIKNYPFYTEIVIFPDGHVEYAIPSHQEKLCQVLSKMKNWTRQEVIDNTPKEYYFDWMTWQSKSQKHFNEPHIIVNKNVMR